MVYIRCEGDCRPESTTHRLTAPNNHQIQISYNNMFSSSKLTLVNQRQFPTPKSSPKFNKFNSKQIRRHPSCRPLFCVGVMVLGTFMWALLKHVYWIKQNKWWLSWIVTYAGIRIHYTIIVFFPCQTTTKGSQCHLFIYRTL